MARPTRAACPDGPRVRCAWPPPPCRSRSPFTEEGRAALIHSICHIEFNAINLALDAVWRFGGMPEAYYRDWWRVADEEAQHFTLLHAHLRSMGWQYGDFPAHDGLWAMCEKTKHDVVARMALVPRTLEARGLDATPLIQAKLARIGTPDAIAASAILDIILRDELGHVAIGNRWYRWLCESDGLDPVAHYRVLYRRYERAAAAATVQPGSALACWLYRRRTGRALASRLSHLAPIAAASPPASAESAAAPRHVGCVSRIASAPCRGRAWSAKA